MPCKIPNALVTFEVMVLLCSLSEDHNVSLIVIWVSILTFLLIQIFVYLFPPGLVYMDEYIIRIFVKILHKYGYQISH